MKELVFPFQRKGFKACTKWRKQNIRSEPRECFARCHQSPLSCCLRRFSQTKVSNIMSSVQKVVVDEALLEGHSNQHVPGNHDGRCPSLLTLMAFGFLTFNSGMAVYRSKGDLSAISFVAFSYLDLVALFYCLRLYDRTPPESVRREHLKMAVWMLTTLLTVAFSYKVAAIMPFPVQVVVWAMAGATVLGGFYAFFLHREGSKA